MLTPCGSNATLPPTNLGVLVSVGPAWWLQPVWAAALCPGPACRSWPSSEPAERPWSGAGRRAGLSSTWPGRERPGWTRCPRHGASPAGRRCGGGAGRGPGGPLPPLRAPQTAREEASRTGSLVEEEVRRIMGFQVALKVMHLWL